MVLLGSTPRTELSNPAPSETLLANNAGGKSICKGQLLYKPRQTLKGLLTI